VDKETQTKIKYAKERIELHQGIAERGANARRIANASYYEGKVVEWKRALLELENGGSNDR
jgi:hypothetical protein